MQKDNRILFYTDGSGALQPEPQFPEKRKSRLPVRRRSSQKRLVLYYDPVALLSLAVTAVMLVLLVAGAASLWQAKTEAAALESHVAQLQQENAQLRKEYEAGYDLGTIREEALAMGLVPQSQAETISITVELPREEPAELTLWEQVWTFLTGLFA
jgi:cell division protein FtsL